MPQFTGEEMDAFRPVAERLGLKEPWIEERPTSGWKLFNVFNEGRKYERELTKDKSDDRP
jgi:hypothetical protein